MYKVIFFWQIEVSDNIHNIHEMYVNGEDHLRDIQKIYNHVFTLDGTMNYVLSLLIEHCKLMAEPV